MSTKWDILTFALPALIFCSLIFQFIHKLEGEKQQVEFIGPPQITLSVLLDFITFTEKSSSKIFFFWYENSSFQMLIKNYYILKILDAEEIVGLQASFQQMPAAFSYILNPVV